MENVAAIYSFLGDRDLRMTKAVWPVRGNGPPEIGGVTCENEPCFKWTMKSLLFTRSVKRRVVLLKEAMLPEENRIQDVYKNRRSGKEGLYSWFNNKGHVFMYQELERAIPAFLRNSGIDSLATKTILDIGCGSGYWIQEFLKLGAVPENLAGIDLLDWRVDDARRISPVGVRLEHGNAEKLGFSDRSFDVVAQFIVFSSILDPHMKRKVASEMLRVLKEDGVIIWYDFFLRDPRNSDVRAITKNEIHQLFPGCQIDLHRITVAAPLTRVLAPYSWLLCYVLERIKVFNTHYLGLIRKSSV